MALSPSLDPKVAIKQIVKVYKRVERKEYNLLCDAVAMRRSMLYDPRYATRDPSREGGGDDRQRGLYEISETLDAMLVRNLSQEHLSWWKTKEGGRWFASEFREFSLPSVI